MTKSTTSANAAVEQMRRTTGHLTCTLTGCGGEQMRPRGTAGRGSGGPGGVVKEANISDATQELGLARGSTAWQTQGRRLFFRCVFQASVSASWEITCLWSAESWVTRRHLSVSLPHPRLRPSCELWELRPTTPTIYCACSGGHETQERKVAPIPGKNTGVQQILGIEWMRATGMEVKLGWD